MRVRQHIAHEHHVRAGQPKLPELPPADLRLFAGALVLQAADILHIRGQPQRGALRADGRLIRRGKHRLAPPLRVHRPDRLQHAGNQPHADRPLVEFVQPEPRDFLVAVPGVIHADARIKIPHGHGHVVSVILQRDARHADPVENVVVQIDGELRVVEQRAVKIPNDVLHGCIIPSLCRFRQSNSARMSSGVSWVGMASPAVIIWSNISRFLAPSLTTCSSMLPRVIMRMTVTLCFWPMRCARSVA